MMKKFAMVLLVLGILSCCCCVFAATKYRVNSSGVVKYSGNVVSAPANSVNQNPNSGYTYNYNYYNNYMAPAYVANNQVNVNQVGIVEIVMDFSGSMSNWIGVAKQSMASIVNQIPSSTKLGFRVFGHNSYGNNPNVPMVQEVKQIVSSGKNKFKVVTKANPTGNTTGACSATQQVAGIYAANGQALLNGMNSVDLGGATPLVYALDRAVYQDFVNFDSVTPKKIVLITDGGENCGGDPCEFARRLMSKRSDVHIDVVLVSSNSRALSCLATTTGGHFYNINNLSDFSTTITNSIQSQPTSVPNTINNNQQQYYEFVKDADDIY